MRTLRAVSEARLAAMVVVAAITAAVLPVTRPVVLAGSDPWTSSELITPDVLVDEISKPSKPTIVYVGFKVLYRTSHVPGAIFQGPGRDARATADLKTWAAKQPRDKLIVIYCGCCPWSDCPNIRPAFAALKEMGFTKLQAVKFEKDFGRDWRDKGYPVEVSK
jgi:hypothetical protein